jgi:LmbE family N-acetylglucosaminyl deacetylase
MPTALFVSPHLDDVAFSGAGALLRLRAAGWGAVLVTVFTATVPDPQGFALRCQTDKGLAPDVDYMALRRAEDAAFARIAGVEDVRHWPLPEAPHRGYESAPDLFAGVHAGDDIWQAVAARLADLDAALAPALVFAPQGLGSHVDHWQVIRAVGAAGLAGRTAWYRDTPYAIRQPDARPAPDLPDGLAERAVMLTPDGLARKIAGAGAYASQIGFQFGGADGVRHQLTEFAAAEAARAGRDGFAERFLAPPGLAAEGLWA